MNQPASAKEHLDWRAADLRYYSYNFFLRNQYGERVQRVSVDAKFTCPNVDGTVAKGGCVFCDNRSFSPSRRIPRQNILDQINEGIRRIRIRYKSEKFLAYFQPATNTYAPVEKLRPLYETALSHPQVVGLCIGTRPDCVPPDVLDLLQEIASKHDLYVEYGLQTIHDRSLDWMNRGHHFDAFVDAMERSTGLGFEICVHLIIGLPNESHADILETARTVAEFPINSVKLHNLYAVKNTPMGEWVKEGTVRLMELDEYVSTVVDVLEILPPWLIVERVTGEAPPDFLIGPAWCQQKHAVRIAIDQEFQKRDSWQGKKYISR